jgi:hypothetical protein
MDQVTQLTKAILSENNYKERVQKILEFVQNYLNKEILKMEYLVDELNEKGDLDSKDSKENQEKYVDLKRARNLMNHDINALMKMFDMVEHIDDESLSSFENHGYTDDNDDNANLHELVELESSSDTTEEEDIYDVYSFDEDDNIPEFGEEMDEHEHE